MLAMKKLLACAAWLGVFITIDFSHVTIAQNPKHAWQYKPELLQPFWANGLVEGESVLFIKDEKTGQASAKVLFPIQDIIQAQNSAGNVSYELGKDFKLGSDPREIILPVGSRIASFTPADLRRPAKSQPYELTHRDGKGEIMFGAKLEYAEMQTCITYRHAAGDWKKPVAKFDPKALPLSVARLTKHEPLSMVTLGDSISYGANASGGFDAAPYQPAYPELVRLGLAKHFGCEVTMKNLSVGGRDTAWGLTQVAAVVAEKPQLVILAFGMNDSASRSAADYKSLTKQTIDAIRQQIPDCEFILVTSMLGNRDWIRLKHEVFPEYRDALESLCGPGIVLADLTTVWTGFLELKNDWDQTGNGVNHPNDFGHRVYAQTILSLLRE
jgi:lysophospholipase L1-like esterase